MHARKAAIGALGALSALVFGLAVPNAAAQERGSASFEAARARFEGQWELATSREEAERTIHAAVDETVEPMGMLIRDIARGRLRDSSPVNDRIRLEFLDGQQIRVTFSAGGTYTSQLGRTVEQRRPSDGSRVVVTQRLQDDGSLEQVFQGDGGTRWYVYEPLSDGRVRLTVTTGSDRLPRPMRYSLVFRRR